jgi:hypothetical protein
MIIKKPQYENANTIVKITFDSGKMNAEQLKTKIVSKIESY